MNQGNSDTKPPPPPPRRSRARREQAASRLGSVVADRYRLDEVVGIGGTGAVYRAEDVTTRRTVAVKILFPDAEGFALLATRMEREAVAGTHLRHPNIAAAFDSGALADDARWIAVEFVSGRNLRDVMTGGPIPTERATRIAIDLACAIGACHAHGVIHRDIKPLNVMIDEDDNDTVKLIDFGLARIPAHDVARSSGHGAEPDEAPTVENLTVHGIVFGTVAYMAPETAQGMAAVDARSDLYAFGVLLYELFTGVHPFATKDPVDLFLQHRVTPPPPMRERAPNVIVPPAVEAIVMRLLAKRPSDRFQDARSVEQALREAAGVKSTREPMPTPQTTVPPTVLRVSESRATDLSAARAATTPGFGRRPISLLTRVAAVALVFAAGGWLLTRAATSEAEDKRIGVLAKPFAILPQPPPPPRPAEPPPGAAELATFRANVELSRWQAATDALRALLAADRRALTDAGTRSLARQTAMRAAYSKLKGAPELFDTLAEDTGLEGIELLYEIIEGQGGSRASKLAWERLERPAVQKRASRAIQIALELRMASCKDKPALFSRAEAEGDERARRVLAILGSPKCLGRQGECCYRKNKDLERAIEAIEARQ